MKENIEEFPFFSEGTLLKSDIGHFINLTEQLGYDVTNVSMYVGYKHNLSHCINSRDNSIYLGEKSTFEDIRQALRKGQLESFVIEKGDVDIWYLDGRANITCLRMMEPILRRFFERGLEKFRIKRTERSACLACGNLAEYEKWGYTWCRNHKDRLYAGDPEDLEGVVEEKLEELGQLNKIEEL